MQPRRRRGAKGYTRKVVSKQDTGRGIGEAIGREERTVGIKGECKGVIPPGTEKSGGSAIHSCTAAQRKERRVAGDSAIKRAAPAARKGPYERKEVGEGILRDSCSAKSACVVYG